jgi:hypothetical protein
MNDFIGIYENVLSEIKCKTIIDRFKLELNNNNSRIKKGSEQFKQSDMCRSDLTISTQNDLSWSSENLLIKESITKCLQKYSEEFFLIKQLQIESLHTKIQKTPPRGGFHMWHSEQTNIINSGRILVWTIYLNDIPDGEGETEFLWQGIKVKPKTGTVSIFPAAFTHTHRGNPVYSCDKYIATGWWTLKT